MNASLASCILRAMRRRELFTRIDAHLERNNELLEVVKREFEPNRREFELNRRESQNTRDVFRELIAEIREGREIRSWGGGAAPASG